LSKIQGVANITTDIPGRICTFEISDPSVDFKAELKKYAETNTHLADYTIQ